MTTQTAQQPTVARKVAGTNGPAVAEAGHGQRRGGRFQARHAGSSGPRARRLRPRAAAAVGVVLVALVGFCIWKVFFAGPSVPAGVIAVSGRIEGDDSAVMVRGSDLNVVYAQFRGQMS
jgi:hypothetical protein